MEELWIKNLITSPLQSTSFSSVLNTTTSSIQFDKCSIAFVFDGFPTERPDSFKPKRGRPTHRKEPKASFSTFGKRHANFVFY
uniref:Ovule protein n=1 Tax=Globodera pallida TaxID=36090 RepID=A0A183CCL1_GLOPA